MRQSDSVQHHRQLLSFAKSGEQIIVLRSEGLPFTDSESARDMSNRAVVEQDYFGSQETHTSNSGRDGM